MNLNPLLLQLNDVTGYPVVQDLYKGKESKWISFTYEDERGSLYADDDEDYVEVIMQINLFTPAEFNYFADKKAIKNKLKELGFTVQSIQSWISTELSGTSRVRQTSFTASYTDIDN